MEIYHINEVCRRVGLCRTSVFELTRAGKFPRPLKLTAGKNGRRGYLASEVNAWLEARIAERDAEEFEAA